MDNVPAPQQQPLPKSKNTLLWLIGGIICGAIVICAVILLFRITKAKVTLPFQNANNASQSNVLPQRDLNRPADAIIRVGNEYIYKQDLTTEMNFAPGNAPDKQKLLEQKLVKDSILLQGAAADKLITLNGSIFNSPNKDYLKRMDVLRNVENLVDSKSARMSGTVITIWFFNSDRYGSLGPEKSKQYAFQKANDYYQQVLKKQISIDQALERIKTDKSLDQLGEHKNNAGYTFDITANEEPSFDDNFNKIIRQTKPGQLTPVTVILDKNVPGKPVEALYMFAQVKNKTTGSTHANYDDWLKAKKKDYAVMYY